LFKEGNWVKVSVKHQFKGYKLGVVIGECKDHHPLVYLMDPKLSIREACIAPERGDYIEKITK
jgi:hypothetical protein